jgi:hypothetical protein
LHNYYIDPRSKSGILIVDSSKSGMRFRNKDLESMNKEYRSLSDDYEKQQKSIVEEILQIASVPFLKFFYLNYSTFLTAIIFYSSFLLNRV